MSQVVVHGVPVDKGQTGTPYMLECSACGPLVVVSHDDVHEAVCEHMLVHGIENPSFLPT